MDGLSTATVLETSSAMVFKADNALVLVAKALPFIETFGNIFLRLICGFKKPALKVVL